MNAASIRYGWCPSCITTVRQSPRGSSPAPSPTVSMRSKSRHCAGTGLCHDLRHQTEISPSRAAEERNRLHAPRLRGRGVDAVRRLRPRLDLGGHHRGLFRTVDRSAPGGKAVGHRLLVEDADLFPRLVAWI